jgi:hypothetical protein
VFLLVDRPSLLADCCQCVTAAVFVVVIIASLSAAASTRKDTRTIVNLGWCLDPQRRHAPHRCLQQSSKACCCNGDATAGGTIAKRIVAKRGVVAERGVDAKRCVVVERGVIAERNCHCRARRGRQAWRRCHVGRHHRAWRRHRERRSRQAWHCQRCSRRGDNETMFRGCWINGSHLRALVQCTRE